MENWLIPEMRQGKYKVSLEQLALINKAVLNAGGIAKGHRGQM